MVEASSETAGSMLAMPPQTSTLRITLVGLGSLAVAMGIGRFAFTPLLPMMRDDGLIDIADGGLLASVHFLGYWLGAVCAFKLPCAPKTSLRLSLIAIAVCTLGMGATNNFLVWLLLRWLCGVCSAFTLVLISNFYIKHLADAGHAEPLGWVFSGVGGGIAIAGLATLAAMAGNITSSLSWQLLGALSLVAVCAVCRAMGPEIAHGRVRAQKRGTQKSPLIWSVVIAYGAAGAGYIIPATYLPVLARDIVPSPLIFGWVWPVFGASAFLSTILAARCQRHYSNRHVWATSQIIMAAGLLLPVMYPHIATIIVAGVCVGGTFMIITMMGMKEAHRMAPAEDVMRHISVLTAAFASGQALGPVFASTIYQLTESFSAALVVTSIVLAITALALIWGSARTAIVGMKSS